MKQANNVRRIDTQLFPQMHFIRRADEESGTSDTRIQPLIYSVCCNKMLNHEHTFVKTMKETEGKRKKRKTQNTIFFALHLAKRFE